MRISVMKNPESSPYCNIVHWTILSRKTEKLAIQLITRFYITVGVATDFASYLTIEDYQRLGHWPNSPTSHFLLRTLG